MTGSRDPQKPSGYRGALPERNDTLAKPWLLAVVGIVVLIFVLSALEVPSRFIPEATPVPLPSLAPSESASAGPSEEASPAASPPDGSAVPSAATSDASSSEPSAGASP
jgi:hypothetical protein